jgi:hypothetical protein
LERIKSDGLVRIVPVSIRHGDWKDSVFRDFSVIPENNKPISSWSNIDEAWLHVVNEIKKAAEKARMLKHNNLPEDGKHEYKLTDNFMKALSDTEVVF